MSTVHHIGRHAVNCGRMKVKVLLKINRALSLTLFLSLHLVRHLWTRRRTSGHTSTSKRPTSMLWWLVNACACETFVDDSKSKIQITLALPLLLSPTANKRPHRNSFSHFIRSFLCYFLLHWCKMSWMATASAARSLTIKHEYQHINIQRPFD